MTLLGTRTNSGFEPICDDVAFLIERQINRKAPGRIRFLQVEFSDGKIFLQGQCHTHHAKQVVQEAASEFLDSMHLLVNEIVVC